MTAGTRPERPEDEPDAARVGDVIGPVPEARLAALIRFHDGMAHRSRVVEAEGAGGDLREAEQSHVRAEAYYQTAQILQRLLHAAHPEPAEFRGHLDLKPKPRAQIRAPP